MSSPLSKLSIRWVLPVATVLPVVVVALVLTLLGYRTARQTAEDLAGQNMRSIHERIESHLNNLMALPPALNQLNESRLRAGILSLDDPSRNRQVFFETLSIFPDVSSLVLGSADGKAMWVIRYPGETTYEYAVKADTQGKMAEFRMEADGTIGDRPRSEFTYDPRIRPWYKAAMEANGPTWGSVYVWVRAGKGETLGVSYVAPQRDDKGNITGVINCELTLADISAFLKQLNVGKTGCAFVIERDGNLVATSVGLNCMKEGIQRLPAVEAPDRRISELAKSLPAEFGSLASLRGMQRRLVTVDGVPTQVVISDFHNRRNLDWLIITAAPDSDFLAAANKVRWQSAWIGIGAGLLALAFGIAVAIWLLRPLLAVVLHAQHVGAGVLDERFERHDNREITLLSNALNDMSSGLKDRLRLRHALTLAMEVQQSLLPQQRPPLEGLDVAARSQYCDETGGDYYDYLDVERLGSHSLLLVMGDVMGHGIAAAMLMATARGILRSHVRTAGTLGDLLTHVNDLLVRDTKGKRFMTMFLGVLDADTMALRWASAGHDAPLVYDPAAKKEIPIEEGGGLPLGVDDAEKYAEQTHAGLARGQVMLVGTDGLWESKNPEGELFGKERVLEAMAELAHLDAAGIEAGIYRRLREFCGTRANDDDITYIVIKFLK